MTIDVDEEKEIAEIFAVSPAETKDDDVDMDHDVAFTDDNKGVDNTLNVISKTESINEEVDDEQDGQTKKQTKKQNAMFAQMRLAAKQKKHELEAIAKGDVVKTEIEERISQKIAIPQAPQESKYLNDDIVVSKYNDDRTRALAAYMAAQSKWAVDVADAKEQNREHKTRYMAQYAHENKVQLEAQERHLEKAESLNLANYDVYEEIAKKSLPANYADRIIKLFPEQSPKILYLLGKSPTRAKKIASLSPDEAMAELIKLAMQLNNVTSGKATRSQAPSPSRSIAKGSSESSVNTSKLATMKKKVDKLAATPGKFNEYQNMQAQYRKLMTESRKKNE